MTASKRGMTLIEVMVALIVMGISSYAAYELWTGAEKSSARTSQLGEMGDFIDQANQVAAKVLTDIGPESNRGICRLIRLNQADSALHVIGSGVVPMNLVLFRPSPQGSTSTFVNRDLLNPYDTDATNGPSFDDWNKVFGDGRWIPDPNCNDNISTELAGAGRYQRCYKPDPTKWPQVASPEVLQDRNPRIIVNLSAIEFKSAGGSLNKLSVVPYPASSAAWTMLNAIEHAMLVTVKATWKSVQREESQTVFSVVWPGEYTCLGGFKAKNNVTAKNNATTLYASNYSQYELQMDWWREHSKDTITQLNSAPGFTSPKLFSSTYTKVFFNVSGVGSGSLDTANTSYILLYSSTFPDSDMSVSWYKTIATQAEKQTLQNENRAVTTETALFATGCQERQFRCKRKTTVPRLWSPRMDITTYLDYKRNVGVSSRPVLSFQRGSVNPSSTLAITTYLTDPLPAAAAPLPSGPHVKFIHQNYNPSINSGNISLTKGTGEFLMSLDKLDQAQACPTMCSASNENNSGWYPSIQFPGVKGKDTFVDDNPVACLCCTMKQCYAYGNKMASCSMQAVEALDASLPECEADDSTKINTYGAAAAAFEASNASSLVGDICIAAKVVNGALVYETKACNTNLGSLCYAVGRYFVAKNTANTAIATSNFDGANDVCFNIGFNNVRAASSGSNVSGGLVELLTAQGTLSSA
ncbi:MAG: type II secretion system protein, partial [Proteobacteria bacterium]|nr:type II secretion system protein [Pseudomonadota bacterium]